MARHTFATNYHAFEYGTNRSSKQKLGHTALKSTQHYAKVLDVEVSQDMGKLKQDLGNNHNVI